MAPGPSAQRSRTAHPRVCGENTPSEVIGRWTGGSSPRVRGKSIPPHWSASCHRLIPACAGKTRGGRVRLLRASAHPRVCGENSGTARGSSPGRGSSPRVRGKPSKHPELGDDGGLIPACAGKTLKWEVFGCYNWAHPRVCGENSRAAETPSGSQGSSPRVRGKLMLPRVIAAHPGLIPACAGKTDSTQTPSCEMTAHPRVCGENFLSWEPRMTERGSSPRVRGKPAGRARRPGPGGLIPACAGKTNTSTAVVIACPAHPRVCGENSQGQTAEYAVTGSSPRVRGKRHRRLERRAGGGLIPACAGKTIA